MSVHTDFMEFEQPRQSFLVSLTRISIHASLPHTGQEKLNVNDIGECGGECGEVGEIEESRQMPMAPDTEDYDSSDAGASSGVVRIWKLPGTAWIGHASS